MPIGNDAAGAADDRHEGGDVPRVHDGIETHVGPAARHEQVAVAISPRADEFGLGEQAVAGGAVLIFREIERVAREQGGLSEPRGGATADGAVVERGGGAVADHELTEHGLVNHAEDGLAVMEECDQGAPQRHAGDESFGAVDGIEDPNEFGVGAIAAEFFADDAVGGKFFGDEAAHECFGAAVGERDRRGVALRFDSEIEAAEVRTDEGSARVGEFVAEGAVGREVHGVKLAHGAHGRHGKNRFGFYMAVCCVARVGNIWTEQPIFFVDFEGSRASGILEFGVVEVRDGAVASARTRMCRATGRVRPEDTAVHGLSEEAVATHAPFSEEWNYFSSLRELGPLAAHYAGVENALLKSVWPYPRSSPDFARPGKRLAEWGPWVDSARLYSQLYPQLESGKLESLVTVCGLQGELEKQAATYCPPDRRHYHAALFDALAGALLLASLAREPQMSTLSTMQLLALSTLDGEKRDALQQGSLF